MWETLCWCTLACVCTLKFQFLICNKSAPSGLQTLSKFPPIKQLACCHVSKAPALKDIVSIQRQAYSGPWDWQPAASQSQQPILFIEPFNGLNQPAESHSHHGPLCCRNKLNKHSTSLSSQKPLSRSPCKKTSTLRGRSGQRKASLEVRHDRGKLRNGV